ncbi:MAG: NUDIX domain-containing protein [Promethearchaeota archaeon]
MKIKKIKTIRKEKWISLKQIEFIDDEGNNRIWDYVSRNKNAKAVMIVCKDKKTEELLFVKQYRPPVNKYAIGFPGGLTEPNEKIEETALRELKEETGYDGIIKYISPMLAKSPGLSDEINVLVFCEVDKEKTHPPHFEKGEKIEMFWKTAEEFISEFNGKNDSIIVENDAWAFCFGLLAKEKLK